MPAAEAEALREIAGEIARFGGWVLELSNQRVTLSDEMSRIHGLPDGAVLSMDEALAFYASDCRETVQQAFTRCAREGLPFDEEASIITRMGDRRLVRTLGRAVRNGHGVITHVQGAFQDVTDQRLTEHRLLRSQIEFLQLANALPGVVWACRSDGVVDYANRAFLDYAGLPDERMLHEGWLAAIHPDDRAPYLDAWERAVEHGSRYEIEFRVRRASDGAHRWHLGHVVPVRDEEDTVRRWFGSALDVHDRKQLEGELVQLAGRLAATLESITDAFFTVDLDWRFTYINREAEHVLQFPREELLGKNFWEQYPDAVGSRLEQEYRRSLAEQVATCFEIYFKPLSTWFEINTYPSSESLAVYFRDISDRKRDEAEIEFLAFYDPLTNLPNRRLLMERLQRLLVASSRVETNSAVLFIDLDHFKTLNDTLGHALGDELLKEVGYRLTSRVRSVDTVARFGGDEFVVVLEGLSQSDEEAAKQAESVAEKILEALNSPYSMEGHEHHGTASIGLTLLNRRSDTVDELMKRADIALYEAKNLGRNTIRLFDPVLQACVTRRLALEVEIRRGLQNDDFVPFFQALVDHEGNIQGIEALARWEHAEWGLVTPGEFIGIAEQIDLIRPLGQTVFRQVCNQLRRWQDHGLSQALQVSVNVSAREFYHPRFTESILATIRQAGISPCCIQLELTETVLHEDIEDTLAKMTTLRSHGITFALDDFGTGYSSLYYLRHLPLDVLKIDQSFVADVLDDASDRVIVQTIIALADSLGLEVTAEGVETEAVRDFLIGEGCTKLQGYLFGAPVGAEAFWARLEAGGQGPRGRLSDIS